MKKILLIILIILLAPSVSFANSAWAEQSYRQAGDYCHVYNRFVFYDSGTCELQFYDEAFVSIRHDCDGHDDTWQNNDGQANYPEGESVGGCNESTAYYSDCSDVYSDALDLSSQFPSDIEEWWHFTSTGGDEKSYKCMSSYKNTSGETVQHIASDYHSVDPINNPDCVSEGAFTALKNTTDNISDPTKCNQQPDAHNTGISTTAGDPDSTQACGYGMLGCDVVAEEKPDGKLGGNATGCGAPAWEVNMVNMNLFVTDTPLWHDPPIGPSVKMQVSYNSEGNVVEGAPFGNKWVFRYSSYLQEESGSGIVTIHMPDGREDIYTPNGDVYTNETGVLNVLTRDGDNNFLLEFPDGTVYVYNRAFVGDDSKTLLTQVKDAYEESLNITYASGANLIYTITDAMDKITDFVDDADYLGDPYPDGLIDHIYDSFGRSAHFGYDANNNLTQITDMGGYVASFEYDGNYLKSITDNGGETWDFDIDPSDDGELEDSNPYPAPGEDMGNNYRITITDPLNNKEEYYYYGPYSWYVSPRDYVPYTAAESNNYASAPKTIYYFDRGTGNGKIARIVTPKGGRTDYREFDPVSGKPGKIKDFHGEDVDHLDADRHTIEYTYNDKGFIASSTDAKGNVITYNYYSNDIDVENIFFNQETDPLKSFTYNGDTHDVATVTDRLDIVTELSYLLNGQLDKVIHAKDSTNPLPMETSFVYDPTTRDLLEIKKNNNTVSTYTYDSAGRVDTSTDDKGIVLDYDYDNLNRVTTIEWPDTKTESIEYSTCCPKLIASKTDRAGLKTTYSYDKLKRLIAVQEPGGIIRYEYDDNGNRTKLIDKDGKVTIFAYDDDNRLIGKTYADTESETYTYDSAGLLTKIERARTDLSINYTGYDKNHNLLTIDYSDATHDVTYTYDDYDRKETMADGIGTYTYGYDDINRLTSLNSPWDDDEIIYEYNDLSHVTKMTAEKDSSSSSVTDYYYDYDIGYSESDIGRLKEIEVGSETFTYDYTGANPQIQTLTRPNGSVTSYSYVDDLKRLTEINNKDSAAQTIDRHAFTYNNLDLIGIEQIETETPLDAFTDNLTTNSYNNVNQLTSSTNPNLSYVYDEDGNMTQGYSADGYDMTMTYDAENRLTSAEYTDTSVTPNVFHRTEYSYSGDGMLAIIKKFEDSNPVPVDEVRFVRSGFLPIQKRDSGNNVTREYMWGLNKGGGIGGLLGMKEGGSDYYYLYDGKGNVTAVLADAQNVVASYRYDAFGNLLKDESTLEQPFRFSTKRYDEQTGLSYYGYRFYSPIIGRWLTRDPLGEAGGINLYGFVGNNSVNKIDPLGLFDDFANYTSNYHITGYVDEHGRFIISGVGITPFSTDPRPSVPPEVVDVAKTVAEYAGTIMGIFIGAEIPTVIYIEKLLDLISPQDLEACQLPNN